ncbi:MAG: hypothetical protein RMX63_08480 [Aulosira sp. ZfuCHP01]|nr:hypothetical protein [Aulosira sp. ZfuVER01]MDZ7999642.1 hypothetical protein [Aulosira sp. DedVER01a]MDZ8051488.1 hypothetical protein [Aulosira sp. ZfuCHP01]
MTYIEKLSPWCIVRHFPNMQHQMLGRFRRRSDAEAHLQVLRRLIPNVTLTIIFNPLVEQQEQLASN